MRLTLLGVLVSVFTTSSLAAQRTHVVECSGHRVEVTLTEDINNVAMVRAECVIPAAHELVWRVLSDYDNLEELVPALTESRLTTDENGRMILQQSGRTGLWFIERDFQVTLEVTEVPMAHIGFEAIHGGSFRRFEGSWQVDQRGGGTWVAHRIEIEPDFFAPRWAVRRVARRLMENTIDAVIARCLELPR
jgi:ribosome-associated toxin RatA of RatAB toxin-antitoxin module